MNHNANNNEKGKAFHEKTKDSQNDTCCSHNANGEWQDVQMSDELENEPVCCMHKGSGSKKDDQKNDLKNELEEFKGKYFRALAEIENTRKRLQKEKAESQSFAVQSVIHDFLVPLDHFEQALKHSQNAAGEVKNWVIGFQMILDQLKQVLRDNDVEAFESKGQSFNPHYHEAIETEETQEYPDGMVIEEFSRGYMIGSRVLRPAKVKVAVAPSPKE